MNYNDLPDDKRWLGLFNSNNPDNIAGRSTDVSQITYFLGEAVKYYFPINEVPVEIVNKLATLESHLKASEQLIGEFIEYVSEVVGEEKK